ncbi:MAG TPA: translocation/assembly module TamB domain-containing protein, partial [Thermoanaerobaculia bacterium]|nr:translocation/assembly module TamB domain-containing protein [Thermoanaerobaculia bacterium]
PAATFQLRDYQPLRTDLAAAFRYVPGSLTITDALMVGEGVRVEMEGKLDPLTEAVYRFALRTELTMEKAREVFELETELAGAMTFEGSLQGARGDFVVRGDLRAPAVTAAGYDIRDFRGDLRVDDDGVVLEIDKANYAGGELTGQYRLPAYQEPYPMEIDLRYRGVAIEGLFADWNVENIGLRGAASGALEYRWSGSDLLQGEGTGTARIQPGTVAFGEAPYPTPVSGNLDFSFDGGTVRFASSRLDTPRSRITFRGPITLEELTADLSFQVSTEDFEEIDRLAVNFARALESSDFELLGLGGSGSIEGTLRGPFAEPLVRVRIDGRGTEYNDVLLGDAAIEITYEGSRDRMHFEPAVFRLDGSMLHLEGTLHFPDQGPSPRFDLNVIAEEWPVERALDAVDLDLELAGIGTGSLLVQGTPDNGRVTLQNLRIRRDDGRLTLDGLVAWAPGEKNVTLDLNIGAQDVPVSVVTAFLDLGEVPVSGSMTGTLHLEGPIAALEGAGNVTVREGVVMGEPVQLATADMLFRQGALELTHLEVETAAGRIVGEASFDFDAERFSYVFEPTEIDLSKLETLGALADLVGGRLRILSSGAGTLRSPEIVLQATLLDAEIRGVEIPEDLPPPELYLAVRDGQLVIRGSAFGAATLTGEGVITDAGELDGDVELVVTDMQRLMGILAPGSELPIAGQLAANIDLGGNISDVEELDLRAVVTRLDLEISGQEVVTSRPIELRLADGRLLFESVTLQTFGSEFSVEGFVAVTGAKAIDLDIRGDLQASMLQVLMPDLRAEGLLHLTLDVGGTLDDPVVRGAAEVQNANVKFVGFPQLIDDIYATLLFRGDRVVIDSLRATVGGGSIVAGGFVQLDGLQMTRVRVNARGTDVSLRYFEGFSAAGDFSVLLSGDEERLILEGDVTIDRGLYSRDFDLASSLLNLLLERRTLLPEIAASWQNNVALRLRVVSDGTLAVRNNLADVTAGAVVDVTGTLANPILLGRVTLAEGGELRFQDIEYTVTQGTVNFQNPFRNDPYFDITAESLVRRPEGDVELTVTLTGTLDRMTPTITSDPPIGDLTLLSLISGDVGPGVGRGLDQMSLTATGTSLILQSVGEALGSRILPFADAFRLDPGLLGGTSGFAPTVTFEKQISDDVYVIVIYNTESAENRQIVQWQVTNDWVIQFTRDSEQPDTYLINAVDARFRKRYWGHWGR